jgi:hypothetical protein
MRQISEEWWIGIDGTYHTKVEDGSLVFWRAERTLWLNIWKDGDGKSPSERLEAWKSGRSLQAVDLFEQEDHGLLRFGYLLEEPEESGGRMLGVYSYTVSATYTVQMACYFDLKEDLDWATAVSKSLSFGGPQPGLKVEEPVGEFGHLVLASERVLGPDREPVLFAFREPGADEQDSGWRFFHGDEDEEFTSDPKNTALCPLSTFLGLDPSLRTIINNPPGTCWERPTLADPWYPAVARPDEPADWR